MVLYILVFSLSFIFIKLLQKNAHHLHLLDIPNERSHHCSVIPRGAGIGFISAIFIGLFVLDFSLFFTYWYIYTALLMVFTIGILDDVFDTPPKAKFLVIFGAVFLLWLNDLSIYNLGNWFGYDIVLPSVLALFFTMFALAGFTNALNLIDGLDGLAGSVTTVIILFFLFIGLDHNDILLVSISSLTLASLFGFLVLNWHPAKIFMGDSGSLSLGFLVSILSLLSLKYIHPIVILYLAAIPILDTLIVMVRRIRRGRSPFSPDKTHLHHILVKFFDGNVKRTVVFFTLLQIIFSSIGFMLVDIIVQDHLHIVPLFAFLGFGIMFLIFYMIFTGIKKRQKLLEGKNSILLKEN